MTVPTDAPPSGARRRPADEDDASTDPAAHQPAATDGDGEPVRAPSDGSLAPGGVPGDPVAALWGADLVERFRLRWRQLQLQFVDEPRAATGTAADLVDEAVTALTHALHTQKQELDGWQSTDGDDTEVLRVALRRYRDFLDRLLGL